ncbi:hypothetical protein D3C85_695780 [compost metagenome]
MFSVVRFGWRIAAWANGARAVSNERELQGGERRAGQRRRPSGEGEGNESVFSGAVAPPTCGFVDHLTQAGGG